MYRVLTQFQKPAHSGLRHLLTFSTGSPQTSTGQAERPIYVLLGWLGCKPQYLSKFTGWYTTQGLDTLSYIPPMASTVFPSFAKREAKAAFNDIMTQAKRPDGRMRPIVFHAFSLNGVNAMAHILRHSEISTTQDSQLFRSSIRGYVLDSAPQDNITPELISRGFTQAFLSLFYKDKTKAIQYEHPLVSPIIRTLGRLALWFPSTRKQIDDTLRIIYRDLPNAPVLLMYSTADTLIRSEMVDGFANTLENQKRTVIRQRWTDSEHVMHFRTHKDEYTQTLVKFYHQIQSSSVPSSSPSSPVDSVA